MVYSLSPYSCYLLRRISTEERMFNLFMIHSRPKHSTIEHQTVDHRHGTSDLLTVEAVLRFDLSSSSVVAVLESTNQRQLQGLVSG